MVAGWDGAPRAEWSQAWSPTPSKPTSAQAVAELEELGLAPILLTGDNERAAWAVAAEVATEKVIAEGLPADISA